MAWFSLGWRDGILLMLVLAAIYLVFMLLRLTQVGRRQNAQSVPGESNTSVAPKVAPVSPLRQRAQAEDDAAEGRPALTVPLASSLVTPPAPAFEWDEVDELLGGAPAPVPTPPSASRVGGFGEHLAEHLARSDVEMEVQRMRDEMERMRAEMEELRVARRVSPQYAEAMELSQRGLSAQDVADRLGISLAEAELVHALSRGDGNFDEGGEDGEDRYVASDEFGGFDSRRTSGRR